MDVKKMLLQLALAGLFVVLLKLPNTNANNNNNADNNVIFIVVDDLRADLPAYGNPHVLSPNIDRLSRRSVVFDRAFNQVPVCFPSRHSLLTGMRPDTLNIHTWTDRQHPYVDSLFSVLVRAGFHSAAVGKLFHHPHNGSSEFTHGRWDGDWYKYQNIEDVFLNSTVTPDATRADSEFRDHMIASQAIEKLNILHNSRVKTGKPYILSIGFKLPHTQYHFPARFYHMYDNSSYLNSLLQLNESQNRFPTESSPSMNYRCCAKDSFSPMVDFGATYSNTRYVYHRKGRFRNSHYKELLQGYWAGISFMDSQLGRLLREMDRLDVWGNTMVVFTADHGMLVGERGMWEKYTLYEETAKVPLMIALPTTSSSSSSSSSFSSSSSSISTSNINSEMSGSDIDNHSEAKHFPYPVELVDIVPTVLDILNIQRIPVKCPNSKLCFDFEGKSLWPAIKATIKLYNPAVSLGLGFSLPSSNYVNQPSKSSSSSSNTFDLSQLMFDKYPGFRAFNSYFAITQMRRCPDNKDVKGASGEETRYDYKKEFLYWSPICNLRNRQSASIMGYSIRTLDYRYNAWFRYTETKTIMKPDLSRPVYAEELYSHVRHRYNLTGDLHSEIDNLIAESSGIEQIISPASFLDSLIKDHDLNLNKDIHSEFDRLNTADVKLVVKLHRYILLSFLANKATFNFDDSMIRMRARWSPYFTLNDKGRVIRVINSTIPSNLY